MTDDLPPLWALDRAAKAAGYQDWQDHENHPRIYNCRSSIIAHARTIAQHEQPPVDEDALALQRVINAWRKSNVSIDDLMDVFGGSWRAALAQFKRELEARK